MYAARDGAPDAARALAKAGADVNAVDPDGTTPLILAIMNSHYDTANVLLEAGANPNITDKAGMARAVCRRGHELARRGVWSAAAQGEGHADAGSTSCHG